jgi:hypothetical protein
MKKLTVIVLAAIACASCLEAMASDSDPAALAAAAKRFYSTYYPASSAGGGVPTGAALTKIEPLMSPKLVQLLNDAAKSIANYHATKKADAGHLIFGDAFSSHIEGPSSFEVGNCTLSGDSASCPMRMMRQGLNLLEPVQQWTDTIVFVRTSSGWLVDDIEYGDWRLYGSLLGEGVDDSKCVAVKRLSQLLKDIANQCPLPPFQEPKE